jgi:hypothetical protein
MKKAPAPISPLPLMSNFDDAEALFAATKDPLYLAFVFQLWLDNLVRRAAAEYNWTYHYSVLRQLGHFRSHC